MRLKQSKGVQDFNRALAINPTLFQVRLCGLIIIKVMRSISSQSLNNIRHSLFFQAYLSRACYYGLKKMYSKAILNCNEAIKLQPNSVRGYLYRYVRTMLKVNCCYYLY